MKKSDIILLRSLILEQVEELFSDGSSDSESTFKLERDSLDDQVDSFILKFEKDSIKEDKDEALSESSLSNLSLKFLLEQPEEEDEPADDADEDEDADADADAPADPVEEPSEPAGSEDVEDVEPVEKIPKLPLDVDAFSKRIARLAMNFENLLDPKVVIINRAMNFLLENYDKNHADEMRDILDTQFDFNLDGGKETPPAPFAVGANPAGAGMSGGGG